MAMMRLEGSGTFVYADYDPLGDSFGVLLNYGQDDEISDLFSSDKFRAECEKHREWFKKGWIASIFLPPTVQRNRSRPESFLASMVLLALALHR